MKSTVLQSVLLVAPLLAWPHPGLAGSLSQDSSYGAVQHATVIYTEDGISQEFNPTILVARVGTFVEDRVAIEGRFGFGLSDDSHTINGVNVDLEVDRLIGVYLLGHVPVGERSSIYGAFGFTDAEATATGTSGGSTATSSGSESGISFGFGTDIGVNEEFDINLEYMQYLSKSSFDADAIGIGIKFQF